jgi:peptidoglycan hydrolase CwlO-like protein
VAVVPLPNSAHIRDMKFNKGQMSTLATIITASAMVLGSLVTSYATASNRINTVQTKVEVIAEREENHYKEVQQSLQRIEKKIDSLNTK